VDHKDGPPPEIVIIRRGGKGHDDGHHGGAWKIAYADFMTAMMALFLVMWLIGASDEKTIAQVASYFNPVPLTDRTTTEKGVQDLQQGGTGKDEDKKPPKTTELEGNMSPKNALGKREPTDESLFADPYNVLTKLASKASKVPLPAGSGGAHQQANTRVAAGDEPFRDPFDPDFRYNSTTEDAKTGDIKPKYDPSTDVGGSGQQSVADGAGEPKAKGGKSGSQSAKQEIEAKKAEKAELAAAAEKSQTGKDRAAAPKEAAIEAKQIESELKKAIAEASLAKIPGITVEQTPEGVLISITDQLNFEMFTVSSAEPRPELVVVMEKLGKALSTQPGGVVIRGHTDGRPFRSKTYDNWRLSTARAQIAYHMLVRGGVDQQRVERIEGYADRALKVPADPNAAQNRRIEILLKPVKT
jgi:chemotaxis protein MotB